MISKRSISLFSISLLILCSLAFVSSSSAQQTLGGITGVVTDASGGALTGTLITLVNDQTKLTRSQTANTSGIYDFVNLPIGTYTLTFSHDGFETQKIPSITVQADRTASLNVTLKVGQVTNDSNLEAEGKAEKLVGKIQKKVGQIEEVFEK